MQPTDGRRPHIGEQWSPGMRGLISFLYFLIHSRDNYIDQDKNSQDVSTQQFL